MGNACCPVQDTGPPQEDEIIRFFMVGTGGAGKTTVVRQLKCLCRDRPHRYKAFNSAWEEIAPDDIFSRQEFDEFRQRIKGNIVTAFCATIEQARRWEYEINAVESKEYLINLLEESRLKQTEGALILTEFKPEITQHLLQLWTDPGTQRTYTRRNEYDSNNRIEDGTYHFMSEDHIRRIFNDQTELTSEDVVHSRYPTTGIQNFRFGIDSLRIQIHDMGGQAVELARLPEFILQWFHGTQSGYRNFLLYVTSMAEFSVVEDKETGHTALDRSVRTLDIILRMPGVPNCGVLIFLNKLDRFYEIVEDQLRSDAGRKELLTRLGPFIKEKEHGRIKSGTVQAHDDVLKGAVTRKFMELSPIQSGEGRGVYTRYTQAVDGRMMAAIFDVIRNEILNDFIERAGFIF